jgi:hypothetical protein
MEVPDLDGIDAMPMGNLTGLEQIVDRGHMPALIATFVAVPIDLAEMTAFGMRLESKPCNQLPNLLGLAHKRCSMRIGS